MPHKLKDEIIKAVQHDSNNFQLVNHVTGLFHSYIYNDKGDYLIGGEEVATFISQFIKLYE